MDAIRSADDIILSALRTEVSSLIVQCTPDQQAFFGRIYPHGIDKMKEAELKNSIGLIGRTIRKNETGDMRGRLPTEVAAGSTEQCSEWANACEQDGGA